MVLEEEFQYHIVGGKKKMKQIKDLEGKIFMTSSACMSVTADGLSWANANKDRITKKFEEADNVIVLSCQVTDLAILNDFRTIEKYHSLNPDKNYFISGCLAKREDVELPEFAQRLETPRDNYQFLWERDLVNFEKPFWIKDFEETQADEFDQGHLFRNMYPLRIGKGCPFNCSYCTIRVTRGDFEKLETQRLEEEFLTFDDILLVADSPMPKQIKEWIAIGEKHNKGFSIRNVEPKVAVACEEDLIRFADQGLLKVFHSPIQSNNPVVLEDMRRSVPETLKTIDLAKKLKERGTFIATNIIIDYKGMSQNFDEIYGIYDYVSWNPLWDGKWDRKKAEQRFQHYLGGN